MDNLVLITVLAAPVGLVLGLLGGGGTVLTVPILLYGLKMENKEAIATSLLIVAATSFIAAISHAFHRTIDWKIASLFAPTAMLGAFVGGKLAKFIPGKIILFVFAVTMLVTAYTMWRGRKDSESKNSRVRYMFIGTLGAGLGLFTGLIGAGGGFLIVPVLTLILGLPIQKAIGTSLILITVNSGAGFLGYQSHVHINLNSALLMIAVASACALIGAYGARHINQAFLRKGFSVFVAVMGAYMVVNQLLS